MMVECATCGKLADNRIRAYKWGLDPVSICADCASCKTKWRKCLSEGCGTYRHIDSRECPYLHCPSHRPIKSTSEVKCLPVIHNRWTNQVSWQCGYCAGFQQVKEVRYDVWLNPGKDSRATRLCQQCCMVMQKTGTPIAKCSGNCRTYRRGTMVACPDSSCTESLPGKN